MVILDETKEVYKYVFSNSLDDIKTIIHNKINRKINLDIAKWESNPMISKSVKHLMNFHNVNFSMTTYEEDKLISVKIFMRVGDKWFRTVYYDISGVIYSYYDIALYNLSKEYITKLLDDPMNFKKYIKERK